MSLQLASLLSQLSIKTKSLDVRKFDLNYIDPVDGDLGWAQRPFVGEIERQYNDGLPVRIIVLKARQLGISTATEGTLFNWSFLHPGTHGLVIAHEKDSSEELFQMTKRYWDTWPYKRLYTQKYNTKQSLSWTESGSQLRVATAKNVQSGRGSTLHAVHLSEFAFYPDPKTLMTGLNQTIPHKHGTIVVVESTANGMGNYFHEMWEEAEAGESDYVPLFFPWYKHPEYRIVTTISTKLELDKDEERPLLALMLKDGIDEDTAYQCIAWRRWAVINKCNGDVDDFHQEYPSTPEEAFVTSGSPIFNHKKTREVYDKENKGVRGYLIDSVRDRTGVRFVRDVTGPLTIYKLPRPSDRRPDRYFVAGDPSESIQGDPACIQVINRQTYEQVAVWHGRITPIKFAHEMIRIGKLYNNAMLCPEVEGGGQATVATLINKGYPSIWMHRNADRLAPTKMSAFGWSTNWQRKSWCIGELQRCIIDNSIIIHDRVTYNQLINYVQRDDGTWGNADPSVHDDAVMALAIAITASRAEGPFTADHDLGTGHVIADIYNQEFEGVS